MIREREKKQFKHSAPSAQALIEFALVLPIVLMIVLGAIDFGRLFFLKMSLVNAAREGANYLAFFPEDADDGYVDTFSAISDEGNNSFLTLTEADVTYTGCCTRGQPVEVSVTQSVDLILEGILTTLGIIGGPLQLTGIVSMVVQ